MGKLLTRGLRYRYCYAGADGLDDVCGKEQVA